MLSRNTKGGAHRAGVALLLVVGSVACSESATAPEPIDDGPEVITQSSASGVSFDRDTYKITCLEAAESPLRVSSTCPVLRWEGVDYWALSYGDNRSSMAIHAFNRAGQRIGWVEKVGARYVVAIEVDEVDETVTFHGQGNRSVTLTYSELRALR